MRLQHWGHPQLPLTQTADISFAATAGNNYLIPSTSGPMKFSVQSQGFSQEQWISAPSIFCEPIHETCPPPNDGLCGKGEPSQQKSEQGIGAEGRGSDRRPLLKLDTGRQSITGRGLDQ